MKKRMVAVAILSVVAVSSAWAFQLNNEEDEGQETVVTLAETPAMVQTAINKAVGGATVDEIDVEREDDITVYEASWKVDGVEHEVSVDSSGHVLETERVVSREAVPAAVRSAVTKHMPADANPEFELKSVMLYSVAAIVEGKEIELLIDPAGRLMELEAAGDDGQSKEHEDEDEHEDDDGEDDD